MAMRKAFVWIGAAVLILICVKAVVDNQKSKGYLMKKALAYKEVSNAKE